MLLKISITCYRNFGFELKIGTSQLICKFIETYDIKLLKTLTCLIAGTAFIPVGQFDTYGTLLKLGLKFDYKFDISWDNDPGNLTRLISIINLIKSFKDYSAEDLFQMTLDSTQYNLEMIKSNTFYNNCEQINVATKEQILNKFK